MTKVFIANWKMNHSFDEANDWLDEFFSAYTANYEKVSQQAMIVCPPNLLLDYLDGELMQDGFDQLEQELKQQGRSITDIAEEEFREIVLNQRPIRLGAQNCHHEKSGSFTGEVSAEMLRRAGCEYVILGHSERRQFCFETDDLVAKKVKAAISGGMHPVVCVGESQEIRDSKNHVEFVLKQIKNSLPREQKINDLLIAYEPVWAIGSGVTPSIAEISEMTKAIKSFFAKELVGLAQNLFVLYGGSVSVENSKEIMAIAELDGLLIGKASLSAHDFVAICSN
jgi:triosephosphate isomerase